MGFFGSNDWMQKPDAKGYINDVQDFSGKQSRGVGMANKWLKATNKGTDVGQYGFLNPIREFGAGREKAAELDAQSNFEMRDQPVLRDRISRLNKDNIAEQTGSQLSSGLNQMIPQWMQMSEQGAGRLDAQRLQALIAAMQGNNDSWQMVQKQGLAGFLGPILAAGAGAAGKVATGGAGGGGYGGFGDSAWST